MPEASATAILQTLGIDLDKHQIYNGYDFTLDNAGCLLHDALIYLKGINPVAPSLYARYFFGHIEPGPGMTHTCADFPEQGCAACALYGDSQCTCYYCSTQRVSTTPVTA
jgi:hypothetical protein